MNKFEKQMTDMPEGATNSNAENPLGLLKNQNVPAHCSIAKISQMAKNLPGIDEAMSFNQLME